MQVDGPGTREPRSGPIIIKIAKFRGESAELYKFIDPVITDIEPRHGPQAGGTRLKIKGDYLNAGSHLEAFIGSLPCEIVKAKRKQAVCITARSPRLQKLDVKMHFDHGKARVLERKRFEYVEDPTIEYSYSGNTGQAKIPKGIPAGGVNITVVGTNFEYVQAGLRIRIHFIRIRIQLFRLNTNPDPDPIRIQGFNDQKLKKITAEKKI